ncbi:TetR/AcrR family transcriptional regulator [Clostridiaceae bacterium 68-1-5]|uniref:TetR/AcrR family transcriptional regulator n=1 Tax=Suipraeoptans intestinalis TaxID=2606628 RepID=A0A6N7UT90_9FIRM|nr:TetR/AcrR family transcriptional regulator [Suipraeoptans intestinalis]MSR94194.1 TetR/AcrR family transcriptional regulator [Suipraeoptans intestinalis]
MCAVKRLSEVERKKEIMNSAAKVIAAKGFEKTTMEEIIAGTTLSKGGVYHYYGSVIEIFKDIMIHGIEYRNEVIKKHLGGSEKIVTKEFMAKELVTKMLDDNPYMPLYIEFLIAKKRNPELNNLMTELQEQTKKRFKIVMSEVPRWISDSNSFQFVTDFINAMILASDVLEARENFTKNRQILEQMIICIFENGAQ